MPILGLIFTVIVVVGLSIGFGRWFWREKKLRPFVAEARSRPVLWSGPVQVRLTWDSIPTFKNPMMRWAGWLPGRSVGIVMSIHMGYAEVGGQFFHAPGAHWLFSSTDTTVVSADEPTLSGADWLIAKDGEKELAIRVSDSPALVAALNTAGFRAFV